MADDRYSRQTMLDGFGGEGQRRLAAARVLIVGVGGLGSAVAPYLAGAGVGTIGLCDSDTVSVSNLQRQILYAEDEVGQPKTAMAARRLSALNSGLTFIQHPAGLTAANARQLIGSYDIVADCTDNFATRYLIDDACADAGKPWVHGSLGEFAGRVALFNGETGVRYADLCPDRDDMCSMPRSTLGVLGAVAGVVGSLQAAEIVKYITGIGPSLDGRLLTIDVRTYESHVIELA